MGESRASMSQPQIHSDHSVSHKMRCDIWKVRLCYAALTLMWTVLAELDALGKSTGLQAARTMKDVGKMHAFASLFQPDHVVLAGFRPQDSHRDRVLPLLTRALEIHLRFQGAQHRDTLDTQRRIEVWQRMVNADPISIPFQSLAQRRRPSEDMDGEADASEHFEATRAIEATCSRMPATSGFPSDPSVTVRLKPVVAA